MLIQLLLKNREDNSKIIELDNWLEDWNCDPTIVTINIESSILAYDSLFLSLGEII